MHVMKSLFATALVVCCAACAQKYYKVTDPNSGKVFYTEAVKRNGPAVEFKDGSNGSDVTLQNSEVAEVSQATYKAAIAPPPPPAPAPKPATAPAETPPAKN